jgi:hypothetical protein
MLKYQIPKTGKEQKIGPSSKVMGFLKGLDNLKIKK